MSRAQPYQRKEKSSQSHLADNNNNNNKIVGVKNSILSGVANVTQNNSSESTLASNTHQTTSSIELTTKLDSG
jgi:hypothetical protein